MQSLVTTVANGMLTEVQNGRALRLKAFGNKKPSFTARAIEAVAHAIVTHGILVYKGLTNLANDFTQLAAAIDAVARATEEVAAAIRNPAVDNNDQGTIDALAGRLEAVSAVLAGALVEEQAEDGVVTDTPPENGEPTE